MKNPIYIYSEQINNLIMSDNDTKELTFNQWQAYLLLKENRIETFNLYCESCKFSNEEKQMIIDIFDK